MADNFFKTYEKAERAYAKHKYKDTLRILNKMMEQKIFPKEKEWIYHWAAGLSYFGLCQMEESMIHLRKSWEEPGDADEDTIRKNYSNYLMYLHYLTKITDREMAEAHFHYGDYFSNVKQYEHEKKDKKKLRIGYLSPDFFDHIVLNFAIQLFAQCNHDRYEVVLYSTGTHDNEVTEWVASMVNGFRDLHELSAEEAAKQIYEDDVDILVDLSGHCEGGFTLKIAAYKPAPVQICGIGYFDTTGLPAIDYFLSDIYCDPPENDALFSEKLLRLPHSHLCYTPSEGFLHFERNYQVHSPIVFGSFNNFAKITDEMLLAWKKILEGVPGSKLLLKHVTPKMEAIRQMKKRALALGFTEAQLDVRPGSADYLKDYMDVDIVLDTYPYPGGGTTCEALYMGMPVINLCGTRHGARFGYSLLKNIGLEELSAPSLEAYIERAIGLAKQPELLLALHNNLREMMQNSPVMDAKGYAREVEEAYELAWKEWMES